MKSIKALVLGAGKMAKGVVYDLNRSKEVSEICVAAIDVEQQSWVKSMGDKITTYRVDASKKDELVNLMRQKFDVVIDVLPYKFIPNVVSAAIECGVHCVNPSSPRRTLGLGLKKAAEEAGVTIVPGIGFDPGIDKVCMGYGARKAGRVFAIHQYAGGFPLKLTKPNPLNYKITWSWDICIETYEGKAKIIHEGKVIEVDKFEEPEITWFPYPVGTVEAYYNWYPDTTIEELGLKEIKEAWEKTVRWPGHCDIWKKLMALNFTNREPLTVGNCKISPREFLVAWGEKYLQYEKGEGDCVVLRVEVIGDEGYYRYEMMDFYNEEEGLTAMARTTGFTESIVAQMIARGDIREKGILDPGKLGWDLDVAKKFFSELAKRGIIVYEMSRIA
jgi:saccharopine dehydrogenase-like NADP-dependent oxidoreductase